MDSFQSEYALVNGIRLHYVRAGEGPLVVLLHGWPEFWYTWRHQIEALSGSFTVVAPDLRGFNLSDKPPETSAYTQDVVAKDIVELVEHLGFSQAAIVGHDWGGAVGWHLALNYPDLVSHFAVLNCPHPAVFIRHIRSNPVQVLKSAYMFLFQIPYLPEFLLGLRLEFFFEQILRGWAYNKMAFTSEDIRAYVEAYRQPGALTGGVNYYRANIQAAREQLPSKGRMVLAPTLMLWGAEDKVLSRDLTEGTGDYVDGPFTLRFLSPCSHWVQNDQAEAVNRELLEFLLNN